MSDEALRPETPEELAARLTPPPLGPESEALRPETPEQLAAQLTPPPLPESEALRPETPEELAARLTPPPLSPEYREGFPWRPRRGSAAATLEPRTADLTQSAETDAETAADADVAAGCAPVTPRDVSESAMRAVTEIDATIASLQAMRTQLLAGIGAVAVDDAVAERLDAGVGVRDVACELALLQRRSDRTVQAELNRAMLERDHWPATLRAWGEARIHRGHVHVIVEIGAAIRDPQSRAAFEAALIPHAERVNPGRLRAIARRELEQHLDEPLEARHRRARDRRGVFFTDLDDGMSQVLAIVPTVLARGSEDRLTQLAKACGSDDPRTFDQRRADLVCDLLLTGEPTGDALQGIRADVSVVIPPAALLGTDENRTHDRGAGVDTPGGRDAGRHLDARRDGSHGGEAPVARLSNGTPIDPESARLLAGQATAWTRLFTVPLSGHVTAVDTYTPSAPLKRLLRARDQRCRWPGCNARAIRCDIDHTKPWAEGGKTEECNLAHFCRRHHTLKGAQLSRARRWKVRQLSPGVLEFTSPMGLTYTDHPPPVGPVFRDRAADIWQPPVGAAVPRGDIPF